MWDKLRSYMFDFLFLQSAHLIDSWHQTLRTFTKRQSIYIHVLLYYDIGGLRWFNLFFVFRTVQLVFEKYHISQTLILLML